MRKKNTESVAASSPTWETLEAFARPSMQQLLQRMLEEEVDGVLGRGRYERRDAVDAGAGYRNGFGKPRRLSLSSGTITLRRPRVRGLEGRFESRLRRRARSRTYRRGVGAFIFGSGLVAQRQAPKKATRLEHAPF